MSNDNQPKAKQNFGSPTLYEGRGKRSSQVLVELPKRPARSAPSCPRDSKHETPFLSHAKKHVLVLSERAFNSDLMS